MIRWVLRATGVATLTSYGRYGYPVWTRWCSLRYVLYSLGFIDLPKSSSPIAWRYFTVNVRRTWRKRYEKHCAHCREHYGGDHDGFWTFVWRYHKLNW